MVTVVIPAYNAEKFILRAIASVLGQTHADLELIVVDDGSTDDTRRLADQSDDPRVRVDTGPNRGPSVARNRGLHRARGELIAFLDADDYWFPDKLAKQVEVMGADPSVAAVGTLMRYESADGAALGVSGHVVGPDEQPDIAAARLMPFNLSSALFRTRAVAEIGGFDEGLEVAADLDLVARIARKGSIVGLPEVLGAYRVHDDSISARRFEQQRLTTRFIRARLASEDQGRELSWQEFHRSHRPSFRQRHGDRVQAWYRAAGQSVAARRWAEAAGYGALALLSGPRYTFQRLYRQLSRGTRYRTGGRDGS